MKLGSTESDHRSIHLYYALLCCIGVIAMLSSTIHNNNIFALFGCTNIIGLSSAMTNYFASKYYGEKNMKISISSILVLLLCALIPISEEYLFRHAIYNDFESIFNKRYAVHLTSLLFGIAHSSNYLVYKYYLRIEDKSLFVRMILQVIHTIIIGYILSSTNSLLWCIYLHSYYNTFVILLMNGNNGIDKKDIDKKEIHCLSDTAVYIPKRRHSFSQKPNSIHKNKYDNYQFVTVTKELYDEHYLSSMLLSNKPLINNSM